MSDNLTDLNKIVAELKEGSNAIITKSLKLFNELLVSQGEIYESFRDQTNESLTNDQIDSYYTQAINDYISDSKRIKEELESFISFLLKKSSPRRCDFLLSVWSGDIYDSYGIDGLLELHEDLLEQERNMTMEAITGMAMEYVS